LHITRADGLVPLLSGLADQHLADLRNIGVFCQCRPSAVDHLAKCKIPGFPLRHPIIVQFGLYVSPVGFGSIVIPEQWRLPYSLNPMVGVIDGFRWCKLRGQSELY
jgi:hypothetical protein